MNSIEPKTQKEIIQGLTDVKIVFDSLNSNLAYCLHSNSEDNMRLAFEFLDDMATELNTLRQAMNKAWVELDF